MNTNEVLKSDARKHQVIAINKLRCALSRLTGKAELNGHDLFTLADKIDVPRGVIGALKKDGIDDMTLTDYFRIKELLYSTSLDEIDDMLGRNFGECPLEEAMGYHGDDEYPYDNEEADFIRKTNGNLKKYGEKIDEKEALNAKETADEDQEEDNAIKGVAIINGKRFDVTNKNLNEVADQIADLLYKEYGLEKPSQEESDEDYEEKASKTTEAVKSAYDKAVKETQMKLFGDTELLDNKTLGDLKYYIYKNDWDKEFDLELINHRESVLLFLYRKLQEEVDKNQLKNCGVTKEQQKNLNDIKKKAEKMSKKEEEKYKKQTEDFSEVDFMTDLFRKFGLTI